MSNSVVQQPLGNSNLNGMGPLGFELPQLAGYSFVAQFADAADTVPMWGIQPGARDRALRAFWPNEPFFASALYGTVARYAAFGWTLKGGPRTVRVMQSILHGAEHGLGWIPFVSKVLIDLYTQDNGAFIEVVRASADANSPVTGLNHLDSGRCVRTGKWDTPVTYYDITGKGHAMPWYNVIPMAEFPSPNENMRGVQYCALTRCLKAAQIMREIQTLNREKVSGRFTKRIHLVSGIPTRMIDDAVLQHQQGADAQGLTRYIQPLIIGSLDPTANVTAATLDLASLPDNFNEEVAMHWYVTQLALAFGSDFQDFAPLPGRAGSGTPTPGTAAGISHLNARGKGPAMFMRTLEHALNWHGVMPTNVTFAFGEQDNSASYEQILLMKEFALTLQVMIEAGIITDQVARQMMADRDFLEPQYIELMGETNVTDEITQPSSELAEIPPLGIAEGDPGPKEPPGTPVASPATGAPPTPSHANSNRMQTKPGSATRRPAVPA